MEFTTDERSLISYCARQESALHYWGVYFAALTPIFVFSVYGLFRQDVVALGVAFFVLLGLLLWRLSVIRCHRTLLASICHKLDYVQADSRGSAEV